MANDEFLAQTLNKPYTKSFWELNRETISDVTAIKGKIIDPDETIVMCELNSIKITTIKDGQEIVFQSRKNGDKRGADYNFFAGVVNQIEAILGMATDSILHNVEKYGYPGAKTIFHRNNITTGTGEKVTRLVNMLAYNSSGKSKDNSGDEDALLKRLGEKGFSTDLNDWKMTYSYTKTVLSDVDDLLWPDYKIGEATAAAEEKDATPAPGSVEYIVNNAITNSTKRQVIFTGAPGTGKTYSVERYVKRRLKEEGLSDEELKDRKKFVQFHSSFDYTDFVEGLRPIEDKDGKMKFVRMDGIFKDFCRKAAETGDKKYYFIIDEINRADLGRVFGELMYCFEKRGPEYRVDTQYSNLPSYGKNGKRIEEAGDVFKDGFYIPENVVILGTMNDIDRSVETFDFALRRRFDWVEINANSVMERSLESMVGVDIEKAFDAETIERIIAMNNVIAKPPLGREFMIGPAYFKGYDGTNLEDIWEHNIEPILREYIRGRNDTGLVEKCEKALFGDNSPASSSEPDNNDRGEATEEEFDGTSDLVTTG